MLSIIVPVQTVIAATRQTLDYLVAQRPRGIDLEILVVGGALSTPLRHLLAGYGDAVGLVESALEAGLAAAFARGARASQGDSLVCLPTDFLPAPTWLLSLHHHATTQPTAAVVGSLIVSIRETVEHVGYVIGQDQWPHPVYAGFPADHPAIQAARPVAAVGLAGVLIRRAAWEEVGGLVPALGDVGALVDFCLRLGARRQETHICPSSRLVRLLGDPPQLIPDSPAGQFFRERWADRLTPDDLSRYLADGLVRIDYPSPWLSRWTIDPVLGVIDATERAAEADQLLAEYTTRLKRLQLEDDTHY